MRSVRVGLNNNAYDILIGHKILPQIGSIVKKLDLGTEAFMVTNAAIARRYGHTVKSSFARQQINAQIFLVPEGEGSKSPKEAFKLLEKIAARAVLKKPFIVALGGGVIGDLAGYVAATYRRGIPYIQVPTSFLAQIDSAIGGKVGIDLNVGKNLVGAFYQPKIVFSDVACLASLPVRQIRNGLAEAIKYGVIDDAALFSFIERNYPAILRGEVKKFEALVVSCSKIKAKVVERDEKETKGIRIILNFGHTVGHAIEAAGKFKLYQHGEAIALGMRVAANISVRLNILSVKDQERINTLITNVGLPQRIKGVKPDDIIRAMGHDKKFLAGKNRFVLATQIGRVKLVSGVPVDVIKKAIRDNSY